MTRLDYTFERRLMLEREDSRVEGHAEELEEDIESILPVYNIICQMTSNFDVDEAYKRIYQ